MVIPAGFPELTERDKNLTLRDMSQVRAASLRGFDDLVTQLGGDPSPLLAAEGLAGVLDDEEALVPVPSLVRLLEATARALRCPDFGLRLAQVQDMGVLGPVAIAIQNAGTVGDAIDLASRYLSVHQQGLAITCLHAEGGQVELCYELGGLPLPRAAQSWDLLLAGGHRGLLMLGGVRYRLTAVHMPHAPAAPLAAYQRCFGAPVLFHQPRAALVVPRALLRVRLPRASERMRGMATRYLDEHVGARRLGVAASVRMALLGGVGGDGASLERVAAVVAMHPRSLQRRLAAEGVSFDGLRDDVLREVALRLLRQVDLPLGEVATRLGMSQQSVLTRSCRRWFGVTPSAVRRGASGRDGPA